MKKRIFVVLLLAAALRAQTPDQRIAQYTEVIRLKPDYAMAYLNRGVVCYNKENYAQARADWEKALQIDPNDSKARQNLEMLMGY
jgi:Flp pilus assembly protein TadD